MKHADAATNVSSAYRPDKPGRMKNQGFSSPLNVRPLTVRAIDEFVGRLRDEAILAPPAGALPNELLEGCIHRSSQESAFFDFSDVRAFDFRIESRWPTLS